MPSGHLETLMKKMSLTEFRKRCFQVVDLVAATRESTEARNVWVSSRNTGIVEIVVDNESPVKPAKDWKTLR
jgi:hypothetical protein